MTKREIIMTIAITLGFAILLIGGYILSIYFISKYHLTTEISASQLDDVSNDIVEIKPVEDTVVIMDKPITIEKPIDNSDTTIVRPVNGCYEYPGYFTEYMDLKNRKTISEKQIEKLINYWTAEYPESEFRNNAAAFIKAARETQYDPIFLLCLAGYESGWWVSDLHSTKCNPYSINMVDTNPNLGYILGDNFAEGIYNGAKWIKRNYYDQGATCIYTMIYGDKCYCIDTDVWIYTLTDLINTSYEILFGEY